MSLVAGLAIQTVGWWLMFQLMRPWSLGKFAGGFAVVTLLAIGIRLAASP